MTPEIAICVRVGAEQAPLILASTRNTDLVRQVMGSALADAAANATAEDPRVRAGARLQVHLLTTLLEEVGDDAALHAVM